MTDTNYYYDEETVELDDLDVTSTGKGLPSKIDDHFPTTQQCT